MTATELKEIRQKLKLTQKELAEILKTSQKTVSFWESGKSKIGAKFRAKYVRLKRKMI